MPPLQQNYTADDLWKPKILALDSSQQHTMALLALSVVTAAVRSPLLHSAQAQQRNCVLRMAVEESSSLTVTSMPKTTPAMIVWKKTD